MSSSFIRITITNKDLLTDMHLGSPQDAMLALVGMTDIIDEVTKKLTLVGLGADFIEHWISFYRANKDKVKTIPLSHERMEELEREAFGK